MLGTGLHGIVEAIAPHAYQTRAERIEQALQLGIACQCRALDLEGQAGRRFRRGNETSGQAVADGQHHAVCQRVGRSAFSLALLSRIAHPQPPLRLPFAVRLLGVHCQQGIGGITLRGCAQGIGLGGGEVFRGTDDLFVEIRQRQAQRQAAVLRRTLERFGRGLVVTDQGAAIGAFVQPPGQHRRPVGAPARQAGGPQRITGGGRIEIDHQRQRRTIFEGVLADQLLRILQVPRQCRVLRRLRIAGQAHQQGLQGSHQSGIALPGLLRRNRLVDLVEIGDRCREDGQA